MPISSSFSAAQSPSYAAGFLNHATSWLPPFGQGSGEQAQNRHTVDQLLRVMMAFTLMQGATGEAGGLDGAADIVRKLSKTQLLAMLSRFCVLKTHRIQKYPFPFLTSPIHALLLFYTDGQQAAEAQDEDVLPSVSLSTTRAAALLVAHAYPACKLTSTMLMLPHLSSRSLVQVKPLHAPSPLHPPPPPLPHTHLCCSSDRLHRWPASSRGTGRGRPALSVTRR
jgi:hypothetical protein